MASSIAFLAVSLSKPELQGAAFAAHIDLIEKDESFSEIVIGLGDTLYAHNLGDGIDLVQRRARARAMGDAWIEREQGAWSDRAKRCRLLRHDRQLALDELGEIRMGLSWLFSKSPFLGALDADVEAFAKRGSDRVLRSRSESRRYIIEELAADIALSQIKPFTHIYPGRMLESYRIMLSCVRLVPKPLRSLELCAFRRTRVKRKKVRFAGPKISLENGNF